jgi:hypothetical protein
LQLFERINREKALINEYQQTLNNINGGNAQSNLVLPMSDSNMVNFDELYESEQILIKENNLLEVFIDFIFRLKMTVLRFKT